MPGLGKDMPVRPVGWLLLQSRAVGEPGEPGCCSPPEEDHISPAVAPPTSARCLLAMSACGEDWTAGAGGKQCLALSPCFLLGSPEGCGQRSI